MALRSPFGPAEAGAPPEATPSLGNGLSPAFPPMAFPNMADPAPEDTSDPEEDDDAPASRPPLNAWGRPFGAGLGLKPPSAYPGDNSATGPDNSPQAAWPGSGPDTNTGPGTAQLRPPAQNPWTPQPPTPPATGWGAQANPQEAPPQAPGEAPQATPTPPAQGEPDFPGLQAPNLPAPPTRQRNSPLTNATLAGQSPQGHLAPPPLFSTPAAQNQYADLSRFLQDHQTVGRLIQAHPAAAAQGLHLWQSVINNPALPEVQRQQTLAGLHQMVMASNNTASPNGAVGSGGASGEADSSPDQTAEPDQGNPGQGPSPSGESPPPPPQSPTQTVRAGDYGGSLERLARAQLGANARQADISRYVAQLVEINGLHDLRRIAPEQTLTLPDANTPQPQPHGPGRQIYAQDMALGRGGRDGGVGGSPPTQEVAGQQASPPGQSKVTVEEEAKGVNAFLQDSFGRLARGQARGPNETDLTRDELVAMRDRIGQFLSNPYLDADSYRHLSSLAVYLHTLGNQYGLLGPEDMGREMLEVGIDAMSNSGNVEIPIRVGLDAIKPKPKRYIKRDSTAPRGDMLNVGSGDDPIDGVTNVDVKSGRGVTVIASAENLPYGDGTIKQVEVKHPYPFYPVTKEVARIMKPGAYLYVTGHRSNKYAKPVSEEVARANGFQLIGTRDMIAEHRVGVSKSSDGKVLNKDTMITTIYRRLPLD